MWAAVLAFLTIDAFSEENGKKALNAEQKTKLTETFGEAFVQTLEASFNESPEGSAGENAAHALQLKGLQDQLKIAEIDRDKFKNDASIATSEKVAAEKKVGDLQGAIKILSAKSETEPPAIIPSKTNLKFDAMNDKFLGGVNLPFMAIDEKHPYNKRAYASLMARRGIEIHTPMASSMDYTSLKADLGDYYRIRKQEQIQSFVATLPSLESIFPLESGYQDQAALVNLFMGEFSQADNTGSTFDNVVKGTYEFQAEILTMYDVMFAHKFTKLKELEKSWIGYLNREGSDTMKWSFIEFILVETSKVLHNERELRRIKGVYKAPTTNVAGPFLQAANGYLKFIKNQIAAFKVKAMPMGEWTSSTICGYVYAMAELVPAVWRDSGLLEVHMSDSAWSAYKKNNETLYGVNQDYKPNTGYIKEYPNIPIVVVPNMGASKRIIITLKNNFRLFEDQANEMLNFNIEQQDWSLKVWSNWKESTWAMMVGKKYVSLAAMPDDYSTQVIWCNDVDEPATYYISMDADDVSPSVLNHTSLVSVANTGATAITHIDDAVIGQEIRLKCGNATNAVTIAKADHFSLLSAAWTPSVGDILILKLRSDGKFIEIDRQDVTTSATAIADGEATPDVLNITSIITVANTGATAITDLVNSVHDVTYTIYGGSNTNSTTIASAGNFVLTAGMTLSLGTWITLVKSKVDDKFYEISRG